MILTERESEVCRLICEGLSKAEIAQKLCLSPNTVKVHIRHILEKYNFKNTKQLILYFSKSKEQ